MKVILPSISQSVFARRLLPAAEWMAENAYIPPGTHRLLAASGLAAGLWGGRHFMDVIAGRNPDGSDMKREQAPAMLRPVHGVLHYNPHSDAASDRWKHVVDRFAPALLGGAASFVGAHYFFHGRMPGFGGNRRPWNALTVNAEKMFADGKLSLQTVDHLTASAQATRMRAMGAVAYVGGAPTLTDKLGGLLPLNHNNVADGFMMNAGIVTWLMGKRGRGSLILERTMTKAARWAEGNLHARGNPAGWAQPESPEMLAWAKDALMNLPNKSEAQIKAVAHQMSGVIHNAWKHIEGIAPGTALTQAQQEAIHKTLHGAEDGVSVGFKFAAFDRMLVRANEPLKATGERIIRLGEMLTGDRGLATWYSRGMGSAKDEKKILEPWKQKLADAYGPEHGFVGDTTPNLSTRQKWILGGSLAGGLAAVTATGATIATRINKRARKLSDGSFTASSEPDPLSPAAKPAGQNNVVDWVNGTPLDMMEWASRTLIVPPSMHRLMGAAYLSAALFGGMKVADALTGRKLTWLSRGPIFQSALAREEIKGVWKPLRAVHGMLHYTPGSSLATDRFRQAAHYIIPVIFGAGGNYLGSHLYFKDRIRKFANPQTLEDYTDRISLEQSYVFANVTALTSIFNTGSGIHLVPFLNYSSNLQTRYLMGAGLQGATPGFGKFWSGNAGLTPWGVKKTLEHTAQYLGHNETARPQELPSLIHSVIGKLYPQLPEGELLLKKRAMLQAIYEVRDSYLTDGRFLPSQQPEMAKAMAALITGHGFENLLLASGLDPLQADLKSNGASGWIANHSGRGARVEKLEQQFKEKFAERLAKDASNPRDYLKSLANHPGTAKPSANDNAPVANDKEAKSASFSARVRQERGTPIQAEIG